MPCDYSMAVVPLMVVELAVVVFVVAVMTPDMELMHYLDDSVDTEQVNWLNGSVGMEQMNYLDVDKKQLN